MMTTGEQCFSGDMTKDNIPRHQYSKSNEFDSELEVLVQWKILSIC